MLENIINPLVIETGRYIIVQVTYWRTRKKTIETEIDMNQTQVSSSFGLTMKMDGLTQIKKELPEADSIVIWNPMIDGYTKIELDDALRLAQKMDAANVSFRRQRLMGDNHIILFIEPGNTWSS